MNMNRCLLRYEPATEQLTMPHRNLVKHIVSLNQYSFCVRLGLKPHIKLSQCFFVLGFGTLMACALGFMSALEKHV